MNDSHHNVNDNYMFDTVIQRSFVITKIYRYMVRKSVDQGCQARGLMGATLHVGNRAEGRMMFSI